MSDTNEDKPDVAEETQDVLSETDLDEVSGGLNPQPLPPYARLRA